jgi:hypothetical protein
VEPTFLPEQTSILVIVWLDSGNLAVLPTKKGELVFCGRLEEDIELRVDDWWKAKAIRAKSMEN